MIIDGKKVANEIELELKNKVEKINAETNERPSLATIIVGGDFASKKYVDMKERTCRRIGINPLHISLENKNELENTINELNYRDDVNGILIQHPIPNTSKQEEQTLLDRISITKDVDGLTSINRSNLYLNKDCYIPCTPKGIIRLIDYYKIDVTGKHVVIVGRSNILGEPLRILFNKLDATTTVIHSKSNDFIDIIKSADIVLGCVGIPGYIKSDWIKEGAILIDAGYNQHNIGDIEKQAYEKASYYTPVPGGVGPMTVQMLMENTIEAYEKQKKLSRKRNG